MIAIKIWEKKINECKKERKLEVQERFWRKRKESKKETKRQDQECKKDSGENDILECKKDLGKKEIGGQERLRKERVRSARKIKGGKSQECKKELQVRDLGENVRNGRKIQEKEKGVQERFRRERDRVCTNNNHRSDYNLQQTECLQ